MKALSLLQPWASAVVLGYKNWETRSWKTNYRGKIYIHASLKWSRTQDNLLFTDPFNKFLKEPFNFPVGVILGQVDLVDCIPVDEWFDLTIKEKWNASKLMDEKGFGNYDNGRFAWRLENPVQFENPFPVKGALSLWEFQQCRECGCSWEDPCIIKGEHTCSWAEPDLCSFCAKKEESIILRNYQTFISKPNHQYNDESKNY